MKSHCSVLRYECEVKAWRGEFNFSFKISYFHMKKVRLKLYQHQFLKSILFIEIKRFRKALVWKHESQSFCIKITYSYLGTWLFTFGKFIGLEGYMGFDHLLWHLMFVRSYKTHWPFGGFFPFHKIKRYSVLKEAEFWVSFSFNILWCCGSFITSRVLIHRIRGKFTIF